MNNIRRVMTLLLLMSFWLVAPAGGKLFITEIMSKSDHTDTAANGDWWELTNTGSSAVDLTGYSWDDEDNNPGTVVFETVIINADESIIILDESSSNSPTWKSAWGLGSEVNVYDRSDLTNDLPGLGNGDTVYLYDADDNLVALATYAGHTDGFTNNWDTAGSFLGLSVNGVAGAYTSSGGDVGSPGFAVPEPGTTVLLALGGLALRKKRGV